MAFKLLNAWDPRQTRAIGRPGAQADMSCAHGIPPVGCHEPQGLVLEPAQLGHPGLKHRVFIKIEMLAYSLGMLVNLRGIRIAKFRYVAGFLQKRQVTIGFDVALCPGITVPVPSTTKITAALNNADVANAGLT